MTREELRNHMLSAISDEYDKSQGSFFYDVINALAVELEDAYKQQNEVLDQGFAETASGKYLDRKVSEQGIYRKQPVKSTTIVTIQGSQGAQVVEGTLVSSDVVGFIVKESKIIDPSGIVDVEVECEKEGAIGNVPVGAIKHFPVRISGLSTVTNPLEVTKGYDGESDEGLRKRYYDKVRTPGTSGNKYHYRNWALEIHRVGDARIIPLEDQKGTVRVVIIDLEKTGADTDIISEVHNHIEENRPIGATVITVSATEIPINVNVTKLDIDTGNYTLEQVKLNIEDNIKGYLKEIAFVKDYVSHAQIGSIILLSEGVLDYKGLTVNGKSGDDEEPNVKIAAEEVTVLGGFTNDN